VGALSRRNAIAQDLQRSRAFQLNVPRADNGTCLAEMLPAKFVGATLRACRKSFWRIADTACGLYFSYASSALLPTTTYTPKLPLLKAGIHLRTTPDAKKTDNGQETRRNNQSRGQRAEAERDHDKKQALPATTSARKNMTPGSRSQ